MKGGARDLLRTAAATAAVCGVTRAQEPAAAELSLHVAAEAAEVGLGRAFELTVTRGWSRALEPEPWSDAALAPLVVRLEAAQRREMGGRVEETLRYRAFAFALEEVVVPAATVRAAPRPGERGAAREAAGNELRLRVRGALDPAAPGEVELPSDLLEVPRPARRAWLLGAAALAIAAIAGLLARRARARARLAPSAPPAPPPVSPHERALGRLRILRERTRGGLADAAEVHLAASAIVREWLDEAHALRAPWRTTEQLLAAPATARALPPPRRALLADLLARCDRVKFARFTPAAEEPPRLLDAAEELVAPAAGGGA